MAAVLLKWCHDEEQFLHSMCTCVYKVVCVEQGFNDLTRPAQQTLWISVCGCVGLGALSSFIGQHSSGGTGIA